MKKHVFGRKLKRDTNERKALFKNLLTSLVLEERIKTTEAKAKAIKAQADKLVTKAKKGDGAERALHPLVNQEAVDKLVKEIGPRFTKRNGGYTRIVRVGKRRVADNAQMVYIEWSERQVKAEAESKDKGKETGKKKGTAQVKKVAAKTKSAKKETKKEAAQTVKPKVGKKEEKAQKPGFLKQLVTRQKKG